MVNSMNVSGSKMRVSDIPLGVEVVIQTPTDANRIFPLKSKSGQKWHRDEFIREFGDVEVFGHIDSIGNMVWHVPEFAERRAQYCANVARYEH